MQQVAESITAQVNPTTLGGVALIIGALGTFVGTLFTAVNSVRNGKKNTKIIHQTNGTLTAIRLEVQEERAARELMSQELNTVYAILSAREHRPIASLAELVRETDPISTGVIAARRRQLIPKKPDRRRRNDDPVARERVEDHHGAAVAEEGETD